MDLKPIPQTDLRGAALRHEILRRIEADPSAWNQGDWIGQDAEGGEDATLAAEVIAYIVEHQVPPWNCGTAYCFAGHTVLARGDRLTAASVDGAAENMGLSTSHVITAAGDQAFVSDRAAGLLELARDQAEALFAGSNSLTQLRAMVEHLDEHPDCSNLGFAIMYPEEHADDMVRS